MGPGASSRTIAEAANEAAKAYQIAEHRPFPYEDRAMLRENLELILQIEDATSPRREEAFEAYKNGEFGRAWEIL